MHQNRILGIGHTFGHNCNERLYIRLDVGYQQMQKSFTVLIILFLLYIADHTTWVQCGPWAGLCTLLLYYYPDRLTPGNAFLVEHLVNLQNEL